MGLRDLGRITPPAPSLHRRCNVLQHQFSGIHKLNADFAFDLTVHRVRHQNSSFRGLRFQPGRDIDAVAENIIALDDDFTKIHANTEFDWLALRLRAVVLGHRALDGNCTFNGVDGT